MALQAGIVGLPNVGKSTLFNALTAAGAEAANYPFCTIEPNVGIVPVPDDRLEQIRGVIASEKLIPTSVEIVDIAGLVRGASKGEGLGNQFLGHIRSVDAVLHVVRCFEDADITHVENSIDPIRDIEIIQLELILADLQSAEKRADKYRKQAKSGTDKEAALHAAVSEKLCALFDAGKPALAGEWTDDERAAVEAAQMITYKPVLYVCNVDEKGLHGNALVEKVKARAASENAGVVVLCAKVESEISELDAADRPGFLADLGMKEAGLATLARATYKLLGLQTYFTAGPKEIRAWTIRTETKAPQAAGVIHTDFEKGFIKAEVYSIADLLALRSEAAMRAAGKLRIEGKEYVVQDGDVMHFRFNV